MFTFQRSRGHEGRGGVWGLKTYGFVGECWGAGWGEGRLPAPPSLLPAYVTFGLVNTRTAHAHTVHMTGDTAADTDSRQLTIHFLLPCVQLSLLKTESHTFISCARLVILEFGP